MDALKRQARDDPKAGLKQAAQQFEGVFLQMVLKSMREATPKDGLFDSDQTRMFQDMFDQQLAQTLSARGATGLASIIEKQLAKTLPASDTAASQSDSTSSLGAAAPDSRFRLDTLRGAGKHLVGDGKLAAAIAAPSQSTASATDTAKGGGDGARGFVGRVWPHALEASRATGIPAHFIVGQAALESGWGKGEIRQADGTPSHNLFNIKAGKSWTGKTVDVATTEYVGGVARKQVERFRAYGSYSEALNDYARLLTSNSRYAGVLGQQDSSAFARALQQAGYATDPMYADKLVRVIGSETLRQGLAG
ncbi:MAG: flagellar assembly peptidoglycan hydrolase FlgJ [Rhodocyclaceae bacterium]